MPQIVGYSDKISVAPGSSLSFMVSCDGPAAYDGEILRLINGDDDPDGPGFRVERTEIPLGGPFPGRKQSIRSGSYAQIPTRNCLRDLESFTIGAAIWPTTPGKGRQGILSHWDAGGSKGFALIVDEDGQAALMLGTGSEIIGPIRSGKPLRANSWYLVGASYCAQTRQTTVIQQPMTNDLGRNDRACTFTSTGRFAPADWHTPLLMGAVHKSTAGETAGHYNGKIDSPRLLGRAVAPDALRVTVEQSAPPPHQQDLIAAWDFSRAISTTRVVDASVNRLDGELINLPARAVKGVRWSGEEMCWRHRPEHYGAIHFHDDDLYDAGWEVDFSVTIPDDVRSGVYLAHVFADSCEDYIPFCIRPKPGSPTAKVAFLFPDASYLAYANIGLAFVGDDVEKVLGRLVELDATALYLQEHPEFGVSLYDTHSDGSGVMYSSRLRPILDMRPKHASYLGTPGAGPWQFNADTHILAWLEQSGHMYDVISDEDLHREGLSLIRDYQVIVTGTHPEYYSTPMMDALQAYTHQGGRLMYLGGNGFYWRIAYHPELEGVIEVRRTEGGTRSWASEPGEYYHSFTGEYGGLWRRIGRPPNQLVGVGFSAQGHNRASYYRRTEASYDPRVAFVFDGVDDEIIGDFGLVGKGAAGIELDRADLALGTPSHTLVLASSENHTDILLVTVEELLETAPGLSGSQNELVRADLVFFETPKGGAVFSTGSISWSGSLSHNNFDNSVAQITTNVLSRFVDETPFEFPT